jgi:hypothetical protein
MEINTIQSLEHLIATLKRFGVSEFAGFNLVLKFNNDFTVEEKLYSGVVDGVGTNKEPKPVEKPIYKSNFHNPMAWQNSGGRPLRFDGSVEE